MNDKTPVSIDEYIAQFPEPVVGILHQIRQVIQKAAPEATEKISYQMPTFYLFGNLVHFAAFKDHIGFFPAASGVEAFAEELSGYSTSKGTIRFALDKPMPYELIKRITEYRVKENKQRDAEKKKGKGK